MRRSRLISSFLAGILLFFLFPEATRAALRFNEIMYDLPGPDERTVLQEDGTSRKLGREWVEVYNEGPEPVTIVGGGIAKKDSWRFRDQDGHHLIAEEAALGSLTIPPGGYLILAADAYTFLSEHPNFSGSVVDTVMNLRNNQGILQLLNGQKQIVAEMFYSSNLGAAGNGRTLEWDGASWREGFRDGGSPGKENSVANVLLPPAPSPILQTPSPAPRTQPTFLPTGVEASNEPTIENSTLVVVSEFLPNPIGADEDGEWIELFNAGEGEVDLSGWRLKTDSSRKSYSLSGKIKAASFLLIERPASGLTLRNTGDRISLFDSTGRLAFEISYQNAIPEGFSAVRLGDHLWQISRSPTPGGKNAVEDTIGESGIALEETKPSTALQTGRGAEKAQASPEKNERTTIILFAGAGAGVLAALLAIYLKRRLLSF